MLWVVVGQLLPSSAQSFDRLAPAIASRAVTGGEVEFGQQVRERDRRRHVRHKVIDVVAQEAGSPAAMLGLKTHAQTHQPE